MVFVLFTMLLTRANKHVLSVQNMSTYPSTFTVPGKNSFYIGGTRGLIHEFIDAHMYKNRFYIHACVFWTENLHRGC